MRTRGAVERASLVLCVALATASPARGLQAGPDTFAEVQHAADNGDFARGLTLARADTDPLTALRAEVWLLYRARDFDAAYAAAERGLQISSGDLWLSERACASALWLRESSRAQASLLRFMANELAADPAAREAFREPLAQAQTQTAELAANTDRAHAAKTRARECSIAILVAVLAMLTWCGLGLRKPSS